MTQPDLEKLANECASVIVWPHYETNSHGYRAECIAVKRRLMEFLERVTEGLRRELVAKDEMLKGAWGHELPCYYCGNPCSCIAANPSNWPIPLCHSDEPGKVKVHHIGCVMERLVERDELRAQLAAANERVNRLGNGLREQNERWGLYGSESKSALREFESLSTPATKEEKG